MQMTDGLSLYPLASIGFIAGLVALILASIFVRADRLETASSLAIIGSGFRLVGKKVRESLFALAGFAVLSIVSGLSWLIVDDGRTLTLLADTVISITAVFALHRLWLRHDAEMLGANLLHGSVTGVFIRGWMVGFYAALPIVGLLLLAAIVSIFISGPPLNFFAAALAALVPFATIFGARATLMVPAAALGRNPGGREAFRLSKGVGLQLAGALWLIAVFTLAPSQILSWALNEQAMYPMSGSDTLVWIVFSVIEGTLLLLHIALSVAAVSATFRDAILLKNGPCLPEAEPESENAAP
ncbi:hypothetical protein L5876_02940 [Hyphobacterium sp. SN044]|uniref:hypothetical protein n=1 Tax=Hyphobacterium sp. SN044 TaxID=2912575 RepID=UPI001F3E642A|nr:hypothetical protein [Hyphobacterium sp. SN044]MCF8878766.1 hypothetical protein [Hyphobacterium sp. SN044]